MSDNLENAVKNFAESVETIANAIYDSINNRKESKDDSEVVSEFLTLSNKLDVIAVKIDNVQTNVEELKGIVSGIETKEKKEKKNPKSALLGKLFSKDKGKDKSIKSGAADVAIMATSLIAIGMAFNIIGNVNIESVLAISVALPLISYAFKQIGESGLTAKKALIISEAAVIMAGGLLGAGALLWFMPELSLGQLFTIPVVALSMSAAMIAMAIAADELKGGSIKQLYTLMPILPALAGGVLASALILQNMPSLSNEQLVSMAAISLTMGVAMVPLAMAAKAVKGNVTSMYLLSGVLPLIAGGLYLSGLALQNMPSTDFMPVLNAVLNITPALLLGIGVIAAVKKFKIGLKEAAIGILALPAVSLALALSSQALRLGHWEGTINSDWVSAFNSAMLLAIPSVMVLGAIAATGYGALVILAGAAMFPVIGASLAAASLAINGGKYNAGPSREWSEAVGLALVAFTSAIASLAPGVFDFLTGTSLDDKLNSIVTIGAKLKEVAAVIQGGDYTGGPSKDWSEGVGIAITAFTSAISSLTPGVFGFLMGDTFDSNLDNILKIAGTLKDVAELVKIGDYTGGPKKEWAEGVGISLTSFAKALESVKPGFWDSLFGDTFEGNMQGILYLAELMPKVAKAVATGNYGNAPDKDWAEGTGLSLLAYGKTISTLSEHMNPADVALWHDPMESLAQSISNVSYTVGGGDYSNFPGKEWVDNIGKFLTLFLNPMGMKGSIIARNVNLMARANYNLAKSLVFLGMKTKSIGKLDTAGFNRLFGGMVTLSLIDSDNLSSVLKLVEEKESAFGGIVDFVKTKLGFDLINKANGGMPEAVPVAPKNGGDNANSLATLKSNDGGVKIMEVKVTNFPDNKKEEESKNNLDNLISQLVSSTNTSNILLEKIAKKLGQNIL